MGEARGSITVFTGPMFSGKSKALMARLETKQRAHKKVLIIKPALDNRFGVPDGIVAKKKGLQRFEPCDSMPARSVSSDTEFVEMVKREKPDVIGIDEAQFFGPWLGAVLIEYRSVGYEIFVAGLDLDAWRRPFGPMPDLLAYADDIDKFTASCFVCGQDARFTQKTGGSSSEQIQVGAEEFYEARCESCWGQPN